MLLGDFNARVGTASESMRLLACSVKRHPIKMVRN